MLTKSDAGQRLGCRRGVALALTCFGVAAGIRAYKPFQPQGGGKEMAEVTSRDKKDGAATDEFNALTPCYRCNEIYKDCGDHPCADAANCGVCGSIKSDPKSCQPDLVSLRYPCGMDEVTEDPDCDKCSEIFGQGPGDCGGVPCDDACECGVCGSYGKCGSSCKAEPTKGRHKCKKPRFIARPIIGACSSCLQDTADLWKGEYTEEEFRHGHAKLGHAKNNLCGGSLCEDACGCGVCGSIAGRCDATCYAFPHTRFRCTLDYEPRLPTKPIFALPPGAGPVPKKRGAGFSNSGPLLPDGKHKYSCDDASHLNLADSWFYNWHSHPDCGKGNTCSEPMCGGRARAAEYVPIINDAKDCKPSCKAGLDPNYKQIWRDSGVRHLGGFNEPDLHNKLPAKRAAELWVQVQEIAEEFDPPLVLFSPQLCVLYLDGNPSPWLTHFLGNCSVIEGCDPDKIKYIGYHYYSNSKEEVFTELADRIARFYESFGKKLWITEMAVGFSKRGRQVQDEWMSKTLLALETDDRVFRYTWFATRNPVHDFVRESSLFVPGTVNLTSTGKLYAQDWDIIAKHAGLIPAGLIPAKVSHNLPEKATAACEPWCAGHTQGWSLKCGWESKCAGCEPCLRGESRDLSGMTSFGMEAMDAVQSWFSPIWNRLYL